MDGDLNLIHHFRFFVPGLDPGKHRNAVQIIWSMLDIVQIYTVATDMAVLVLMPWMIYIVASSDGMAMANFTALTTLTIRKAYLASILLDKVNMLRMPGLRQASSNHCLWVTWCK